MADASEAVGAEVVAAGLFEPNVPDFIGGIAGLFTWPARRMRLRSVGDITTSCLLAVTATELHVLGARLRIRGIVLDEEVACWTRETLTIVRTEVATWTGRPPPWPALRFTSGGRLLAELKPHEPSRSTTEVLDELVGPR